MHLTGPSHRVDRIRFIGNYSKLIFYVPSSADYALSRVSFVTESIGCGPNDLADYVADHPSSNCFTHNLTDHLGSHNVTDRLAYLLGPDYFTHHLTHHQTYRPNKSALVCVWTMAAKRLQPLQPAARMRCAEVP